MRTRFVGRRALDGSSFIGQNCYGRADGRAGYVHETGDRERGGRGAARRGAVVGGGGEAVDSSRGALWLPSAFLFWFFGLDFNSCGW